MEIVYNFYMDRKKIKRLINQNCVFCYSSFLLSIKTVNTTIVPPSVFHQHPLAQPETKENQGCNIRC